jgi:capsular exopolysaccharide synthesis family protein
MNAQATPGRPEGALGPYLRAIRAHRVLVPAIVLLAVLGAIAFLALRSPSYEASADILVNPVAQTDTTFTGVPVLRDTPGDPTRTGQTAANVLDSSLAARMTAEELGDGWTLESVQTAVDVQPKGQSDILSVTAKTGDADEAAKVANTFAKAALDARAATLKVPIEAALKRLQTQLDSLEKDDPARGNLAAAINTLETALSNGDPSLSLLQEARPPTGASGTPKWLVLVLALLAGILLASGTAVVLEMLDSRVRDQEEALSLFPLPVLARVPKLGRRQRDGATDPLKAPPAVREAYRTLLVQLEQRPGSHRTIMVTSGSSADGKTTSAVNLAFALVGAGHRVILVDFDLRRPQVGAALGVKSDRGLVSLLSPDTPLSEALVQAPQLPPLRVLPAGGEGDVILLEALSRRLPDLLKEAEELADYVVIDTAPLGEVSDALRIADAVDDILIVTRPGHTNRAHFLDMRDLLQQAGISPLGIVLVGAESSGQSNYYTYGFHPRRPAGGGRERAARTSATS